MIGSDGWGRASWRQVTIHAVAAVRPVERAADGSARVRVYRLRTADGSTVELGSDTVCERLSNEHGERILLTVDRAAHVVARHLCGGPSGVFLPGMTVTRLLALVCRHCREPLGYGEQSDKISVHCDRVVGHGGVASARELERRGALSAADLRRLRDVKEEVFAANVHGTAAERTALVARVNAQWRERNVRLLQRSGVVLPAFIAAPRPTRSFVVVLDRPRTLGPAPDDEKRIRTIYPGELLCDSPAHARYMPLLSVSDLPVGATIGELDRRHARGEALGEREQAVLRSYRDAFEVWYEHGPLLPATRRAGAAQLAIDGERREVAAGARLTRNPVMRSASSSSKRASGSSSASP